MCLIMEKNIEIIMINFVWGIILLRETRNQLYSLSHAK